MARIGALLGVSVGLVTAVVVGCGSNGDDSAFGDGANQNGNITGSSGGLGTSGGVGSSGGSSGAGNVGSVTPGSACANASAGTEAPPISLVFMVDKSGSMGGGSMAVKWTPAVAALKAFFSDPASKNISASLTFFAASNECPVASYSTPAVSMRPLPDAQFGTTLDATSPSGGTPTLPAEQGAVAYAQTVVPSLKPGESLAIVLVTDGDPNDCSSNPTNVAAAAATVASTIKTYVVGVGPDATNLDTIATGGGTAPHIQVNTTSAATTAADLKAAIGKIKAAQLGCNYPLPAPPSGQTLDVNAVNVDYTPGGGTLQTLPYSADCSNPGGWHYDNVSAPTTIVMCPAICSTLQKDTSGGKVEIIFGCVTTTSGGGSLPR